ncbi:putative immunity protein [uncultured Nocardioides sp.]|uniref:putative immunity protein n=1 Tax=uncultured Nocardioides sp. TaxID=198441 RepID=UPI00260E63F9|nr:hypothetical protein [uncultured Nocardioides sp.]
MVDASPAEVWAEVEQLLARADHLTAVRWAAECAARAAARFEVDGAVDPRLARALDHVSAWLDDGALDEVAHHSAVIGAHNAARSLPDRTGVRAAARAVAQAVATLRAPEHAIGAAMYAGMAARDARAPEGPPDVGAAATERVLQRDRLAALVAGPGYSEEAPGEGVEDATWSPHTARAPESPTR